MRVETVDPVRLLAAAAKCLDKRPPDMAKYFPLIRRAAQLGDPVAQESYGAWLLEGYRTDAGRVLLRRNPKQAVRLLTASALAGNALAQLALGTCWYEGTGVRRDLGQAAVWYRRAARVGLQDAAANLANVLRDWGDRQGERRWWRRAAALGHPEATVRLAALDATSTRKSVASAGRNRLRRLIRSADELIASLARQELDRL